MKLSTLILTLAFTAIGQSTAQSFKIEISKAAAGSPSCAKVAPVIPPELGIFFADPKPCNECQKWLADCQSKCSASNKARCQFDCSRAMCAITYYFDKCYRSFCASLPPPLAAGTETNEGLLTASSSQADPKTSRAEVDKEVSLASSSQAAPDTCKGCQHWLSNAQKMCKGNNKGSCELGSSRHICTCPKCFNCFSGFCVVIPH